MCSLENWNAWKKQTNISQSGSCSTQTFNWKNTPATEACLLETPRRETLIFGRLHCRVQWLSSLQQGSRTAQIQVWNRAHRSRSLTCELVHLVEMCISMEGVLQQLQCLLVTRGARKSPETTPNWFSCCFWLKHDSWGRSSVISDGFPVTFWMSLHSPLIC